MLGNNLPSSDAVNNLRAMLEIMQLAADSKKAKAVLDQVADAHAEIAGKMAEIEAREKAAVALEQKADQAVAKSEEATNKAITEQANAANMKALLRQDEEDLNLRKAQQAAEANRLAMLESKLAKDQEDVQKRLEKGLEEIAAKSLALDIKIAEVERAKSDVAAQEADLKVKLESLREKIKSLAE